MPSASHRSLFSHPNSLDDTIVAVSSPPGRSLRGLVRLSGPEVMPILGHLLKPPANPVEGIQCWPLPRRLVACQLRLDSTATPLILPALVTLLTAPQSYTGQDMAEIQIPGNPTLLDRLIQRVVRLDARMAEPGEFTFRAFLAQKLDLTQAEGVAATISATSDTQLQAAALLREGRLGQFTADLGFTVAGQLALVEAGIDFVDQDDVVPIGPSQLDENLKHIVERLEQFLSQSQSWRRIEALPRVVLAGAPNSGKSTLFNYLLGQQRAVISPVAHTTRDVLEEPLMIPGSSGQQIEVMLVDIAGLDQSRNTLDRESQAAAYRAIEQADLILLATDDRNHLTDLPSGVPAVHVRTKADLPDPPMKATKTFDVEVSAITGEGMEALQSVIAQCLGDHQMSVSGQMLTLQPRHENALNQALKNLCLARHLLTRQQSANRFEQSELVAAALRQTLDDLAILAGRLTPEDILGQVFATFCIGK